MAATIVQEILARASEEEAEKIKSTQVDKPVDLEYDLGNLLAYDFNDIDFNQLKYYLQKPFNFLGSCFDVYTIAFSGRTRKHSLQI